MTFITEEANHNSKWYNTIKDTDLYDMVDTFADLKTFKPKDGIKVQVNNDETHNNEPVVYQYKNNKWEISDESRAQLSKDSIIAKYLDNKKKDINKKSNITRNAEILLQYGLSPTLINDAVPLFDEENDTMIQVVGIDKENSINKDISKDLNSDYKPLDVNEKDDKLIIMPYSKVMYPHDEYTYNVTFSKQKQPSYKLSIADFKEKIYNKEYNQKAIKNAEKGIDFSDAETVMNALRQKDLAANQKNYDNTETIIKDLDPTIYKDVKSNHMTKVLNTLKRKKQDGWTDDDLKFLMKEYEPFLTWLDENEDLFNAMEEICGDNKTALKAFDKQKEKWFKDNLTLGKLEKEVAKWYRTNKSSFFEAKFTNPMPKPTRITDPGDVAEILFKLGIDTRFLRVPFTKLGRKNNDDTIEDDVEYRIQGFKNQDDINEILTLQQELEYKPDLTQELADKKEELDTIKNTTKDAEQYITVANEYNDIVKQINSFKAKEEQLKRKLETTVVFLKEYRDGKGIGNPIEMNLDEVYKYINKDINFNKELNVPEHDLNNPNENLNQHKFYKVILTPDIISQIVDQAVKKYKDEVPAGYSIPHGLTGETWKNYEGTKALLDTLNMANSNNNKNYKIEKGIVDGKTVYRGIIPYNPKARMNSFPRASITNMVK